MRITIEIDVNVNEGKELSDVKNALIKGVYYGLDIKRIANPNNVKIINIE